MFVAALGPFGVGSRIADFARIGDAPWQDAVLGLLLIDGPSFVDILPMYICLMILTPWILRALYAEQWALVIVASLAVWMLGQSGMQPIFGSRLVEATGVTEDGGLDFSLHFNRLSWQLIFVAGLVAGVLYQQERLPLDRLREAQFRVIFHIALATVILFFAIRMMVIQDVIDWSDSMLLTSGLDRTQFSVLRVANFAAQAYVVLYLIAAAGWEDRGAAGRVGRLLDRVLRLPPLVFLGQHSLQVYTLHVILIYVVAIFVLGDEVGRGAAALILMACWALLYVPGLWKTRVLPRMRAAQS